MTISKESDLVDRIHCQLGRTNNRNELIRLISEIESSFPAIKDLSLVIFNSWYGRIQLQHLYKLNHEELTNNAMAILEAFTITAKDKYGTVFSYSAINKIFYRESTFSPTHQLCKKYDDKLKVSHLLDIASYAIKFLNTVYDINTEEYESALLVFISMELALNNEPCEKPQAKATHFALEALSLLYRQMTHDKDKQKMISCGTNLFHLAIDFLTKGC